MRVTFIEGIEVCVLISMLGETLAVVVDVVLWLRFLALIELVGKVVILVVKVLGFLLSVVILLVLVEDGIYTLSNSCRIWWW